MAVRLTKAQKLALIHQGRLDRDRGRTLTVSAAVKKMELVRMVPQAGGRAVGTSGESKIWTERGGTSGYSRMALHNKEKRQLDAKGRKIYQDASGLRPESLAEVADRLHGCPEVDWLVVARSATMPEGKKYWKGITEREIESRSKGNPLWNVVVRESQSEKRIKGHLSFGPDPEAKDQRSAEDRKAYPMKDVVVADSYVEPVGGVGFMVQRAAWAVLAERYRVQREGKLSDSVSVPRPQAVVAQSYGWGLAASLGRIGGPKGSGLARLGRWESGPVVVVGPIGPRDSRGRFEV